MTTKNNFKKQRKELKKRKARLESNAQTNHRNRSKPSKKKTHPKYSEEFIHRYIKEHGMARAVIDLKLEPSNTEFTHRQVMEMINESIPGIMRMHAGVTVLDTLEKEGTLTLIPAARELMDAYEKTVVRFNENVDATIILIEQGTSIDDMMPLVEDLTMTLMDVTMEYRDPLIELLTLHEESVEIYAAEHILEGETKDQMMMRLHTQRMEVIFPIHRTTRKVSDMLVKDGDLPELDAPEFETAAEDTAVPQPV